MIEFNGNVYNLENSAGRKFLHEDLDTEFQTVYEEPTEEAEEELQEAHTLISAQNAQGLSDMLVGFDIGFGLIKPENMIVEALKEAGYKVELSNVSRSFYAINDNGEEVRISDHKRPAYQVEGAVGYVDHEYSNELIVDDNKVTKTQLVKKGFNRLESEEYFLG